MAIDLFPSLAELGKKRNYLWYDTLSEEDQKTAHPFVLARWLTGTYDANQILLQNENVNRYMFPLGSEKALLFKLMATSSTGSTSRYQWIKAPVSSSSGVKFKTKVVSEYYEISLREANLYLPQIKEDDLLIMAEELGWPKEDVASLKKEFTNGSRATKSSITKSKKAK